MVSLGGRVGWSSGRLNWVVGLGGLVRWSCWVVGSGGRGLVRWLGLGQVVGVGSGGKVGRPDKAEIRINSFHLGWNLTKLGNKQLF